jgi:hypothetical protein
VPLVGVTVSQFPVLVALAENLSGLPPLVTAMLWLGGASPPRVNENVSLVALAMRLGAARTESVAGIVSGLFDAPITEIRIEPV